MRIERGRVRPFDPGQHAPPLLAQHEQAAIGAVDVEPGAVPPAEVGDIGERVDRAGIDRARRGDDQPGPDAVGLVASPAPRRARPRACGGARRSRRSGAAPGGGRRSASALSMQWWAERAQIDGAAALLVPGFAGGDDGGEIGHASAGGQGPRGGRREADHPGEPGGGGVLQPDRARRGGSEAGIFVRRRGEEVADRRMEETAARNIAHEAGRSRRDARAVDAAVEIGQRGLRRTPFLRELGVERLGRRLPPAAIGGALGEAFQEMLGMRHRRRRQRGPRLRARLQRRRLAPQPDELGPSRFGHAPSSLAASGAW